MLTRLILVRHGQTVWNHDMRYQGHTDIALTDEGIKQAELVAERLAKEKIAAVYASDLSRALITAKRIAARHAVSVTGMPELREIKFGEWEGLTYKGIGEKWPDQMAKLYSHPDEVVIPGGETFRDLKARATRAVESLVEKHPEDTIAVVSHGGTIRTILCATLNIHLNHVWSIRQDNTSVNIIEYYGDRAIVSLVNDIHHLQP